MQDDDDNNNNSRNENDTARANTLAHVFLAHSLLHTFSRWRNSRGERERRGKKDKIASEHKQSVGILVLLATASSPDRCNMFIKQTHTHPYGS